MSTIIGTVVGSRFLPNASTEAWMSFVGSLIGAAISVGAAIGAIEWQRSRQHWSRRIFLRGAIERPLNLLDGLDGLEGGSGRDKPWRVRHCVERAIADIEWLGRLVTLSPPEDLPTLQAYDQIVAIDKEMLAALQTAVETRSEDQRPLMGEVMSAAGPIAEKLANAYDYIA